MVEETNTEETKPEDKKPEETKPVETAPDGADKATEPDKFDDEENAQAEIDNKIEEPETPAPENAPAADPKPAEEAKDGKQ